MKRLAVIYMVFMVSTPTIAQNNDYQEAVWRMMNIGGELELYGIYRELNYTSHRIDDFEEKTLFSGKLDLNTQSYFWHPNFLLFELNGSYNPQGGQQISFLQPDHSIETSSKRVYAKTSFLQKQNFNFNSHINYNSSFSNRENISELENNYFDWGGNLNYFNRLAPVEIGFKRFEKDELEKFTQRHYLNDGIDVRARVRTTIRKRDKHEFNFSQLNYTNELKNFYVNNVNTTDLNLRSSVFLDRIMNYRIYSNISKIIRTGSIESDRFLISENLNFKLPSDFTFNAQYDYSDETLNELNSKQQFILGELQHQWYESLNIKIFFQNSQIDHSQFDESYNRYGFNINYIKKIPLKGRLYLGYDYFKQDQKRNSEATNFQIFQEPLLLVDGEIALLLNPNIIIESIVVRDDTGVITYQENVDYIIISHDEFIEVQRLPAGIIPNSTEVFIDYVAVELGNHDYNLISNRFASRLTFFNNLFEIYYELNKRSNKNAEEVNELSLKTIDQNVLGLKINYKFFNGGLEKDNYKSNIVPYNSMRYFVNLQGNISHKISYVLNGSLTDYSMIGKEGRTQNYADLAGNITYHFSYRTKFEIRAGYRMQEGEGIDLDLYTGRVELSTRYRQLYLKLSAEIYRKEYLFTQNYDHKGIKLSVIRRF